MVLCKKTGHFAIGLGISLIIIGVFLFAFYTEPSNNNSATGAVAGMESVSLKGI